MMPIELLGLLILAVVLVPLLLAVVGFLLLLAALGELYDDVTEHARRDVR